MTVSMDLESTPGRMDVNTKDTGTMVNSTVMEFTDRPMELSVVDAGKKENVCSGTTSRPLNTNEPELKIIDNNLRTFKGQQTPLIPNLPQYFTEIDEIDAGQNGFDE